MQKKRTSKNGFKTVKVVRKVPWLKTEITNEDHLQIKDKITKGENRNQKISKVKET